MNETKAWYQSKTFWGIIIAAVASILVFFKIDLPFLSENASAIAEGIVAVVGFILSWFGRKNATTRIE